MLSHSSDYKRNHRQAHTCRQRNISLSPIHAVPRGLSDGPGVPPLPTSAEMALLDVQGGLKEPRGGKAFGEDPRPDK